VDSLERQGSISSECIDRDHGKLRNEISGKEFLKIDYKENQQN
jgi:hypothetical protein